MLLTSFEGDIERSIGGESWNNKILHSYLSDSDILKNRTFASLNARYLYIRNVKYSCRSVLFIIVDKY